MLKDNQELDETLLYNWPYQNNLISKFVDNLDMKNRNAHSIIGSCGTDLDGQLQR